MRFWSVPVSLALLFLGGCAGTGGMAPVVDAGRTVSNEEGRFATAAPASSSAASASSVLRQEAGSAVVVMVPDDAGQSRAVDSFPLESAPVLETGRESIFTPAGGTSPLQDDERLDGPVLALLTSARQQESNGDLNAAASSLERAMRIAPREPQVFYRLAQVRLNQGDTAQAEQLARRGLNYASGRPALQAGLWELVAQARERQGDAPGAADARRRARVDS